MFACQNENLEELQTDVTESPTSCVGSQQDCIVTQDCIRVLLRFTFPCCFDPEKQQFLMMGKDIHTLVSTVTTWNYSAPLCKSANQDLSHQFIGSKD